MSDGVRDAAREHVRQAVAAQRPSVGRAVHYLSRGSADGVYPPACRAATVTEVQAPGTVGDAEHPGRVGLHVVNPTGDYYHPLAAGGVEQDEGDSNGDRDGGTWHWPERV